jgi:hypothetical protein
MYPDDARFVPEDLTTVGLRPDNLARHDRAVTCASYTPTDVRDLPGVEPGGHAI